MKERPRGPCTSAVPCTMSAVPCTTSAVRPTVSDTGISSGVTAFHCDKWMRCSYAVFIVYAIANAAAGAKIEQLRQSSHSVLVWRSSTRSGTSPRMRQTACCCL